MRSVFSIYFLIIANTLFATNSDYVIRLKSKEELLLVGNKTYFLEDPSGKLSINDILSSENQKRFLISEQEVFARPATRSSFWFKLIVQNQTQVDAWMEIGAPSAWHVDFYQADIDGKYSPLLTGSMRPNENKPYNNNVFWLPLNKADDPGIKIYYLRISEQMPYEAPMLVGSLESLSKNKQLHDYLSAGFAGVVIILLLHNLALYFSIRNKIYLLYIGYLFCIAFVSLFVSGHSPLQNINLFFIDRHWLHTYFLLWHPMLYFFIGHFCILYLNLNERLPRIKKLIQAQVIILSGIFPMLTIVGYELVDLISYFQLTVLIFYLTCLVSGYYLVFTYKGDKQIIFYVLGWTFYITSAFILLAAINGWVPFNPFTRNAVFFGVSLEAFMFSLALANRINTLNKEREKAQKKALIRAIENEKILNNQNAILEQRVTERTTTLKILNSDLQKKKEKLEEIIREKDGLIDIVAHDLTSPLNNIIGIVQVTKHEDGVPARVVENLKIIETLGVHGKELIEDILTVSSIDTHTVKEEPQSVITNLFFKEIISPYQIMANEKGIDFKYTYLFSNELFCTEPSSMRRIIENLVSNAIKFSPTGGKVEVSIHTVDQNGIWFRVTDTGPGFTEDDQQKMFKKFQRLSARPTKGEHSTGLGLSIVKALCTKLNATLEVRSELNKGSEFIVSIKGKKS